jgi:uncharacterized protein involved in exopolysaccharide biosynthesis
MTQDQSRAGEEPITLKELTREALRRRWLAVSIVATTTLAAAVVAWALPRAYDAIVVLSPASDPAASSALGSLTSRFSGLASLAGLPAIGDSKTAESIAVLQSDALTQRYIRENELLPVLYADSWDGARKAWKDSDAASTPTFWKASQYFGKKVRKVTRGSDTGLVTLTIRWRDPERAAKWANGIVEMTNDYLRDKAIQESERNIAYLTAQASQTNVVEARQAIYNVLETELNRVMLARGSREYAFKIIDPASVPESPSFPPVMLLLVAGFTGGCLVATFVVLASVAWGKSR